MSFFSDLINKLPKLPFGQETAQFRAYFSLNVTTSTLTASVWGVEDNRILVLGTASNTYQDINELPAKSRLVLDQALAELEFEPNHILFGVPPEWSTQDNLKPEYLKL